MPKEMIVVGGPNGAGKTTFALEYVAEHHCPYLSADAIAAQMSPNNPVRAAIPAGREFLNQVRVALDNESDFVVESTLSGVTFRTSLERARYSGWKVSLIFIFLDSATSCMNRVAERVQKGGHFVSDDEIRRRFKRSLRNFWEIYRLLADQWLLVYNSGSEFEDVAAGNPDDTSIHNLEPFINFVSC